MALRHPEQAQPSQTSRKLLHHVVLFFSFEIVTALLWTSGRTQSIGISAPLRSTVEKKRAGRDVARGVGFRRWDGVHHLSINTHLRHPYRMRVVVGSRERRR
jgi:hypothetical protein